jgi:hypothetical protein
VEVLEGRGGVFATGLRGAARRRLAVELRIVGSPLAVQPGAVPTTLALALEAAVFTRIDTSIKRSVWTGR